MVIIQQLPARLRTFFDSLKPQFQRLAWQHVWALVLAMAIATGRRFPLWVQAWSQATAEFVSENWVLKEIITPVAEATEGQGIWVMDRGGDREVLLRH